jgi:homoserine dehydrogenase
MTTAVRVTAREEPRVALAPPLAGEGAPLRVALAGCGTVGGALLGLLQGHREAVRRRLGRGVEVVSVLVRDAARERPHAPHRERVTTDPAAFLAAGADVVVEAIGGIDPAGEIVRDALARGAHVVTANKALLAAHGPSLLRLATQRGARLEFEASVGGAVPVVRTLRDQLAGHGVQCIRGVINGTTNFILDRLAEGSAWEAAVAEAQRLGFAEADPSRDLDGRDAEDKLRVLAWLGFHADPRTVPVRREGISPALAPLARDAAAGGRTVRLVAELRLEGRRLAGTIAPRVLDANDPLASARGEENAFEIHSESAGVIRLSGKGAGGSATASAVLADLLRAGSHVPER